MRRQSEWPLAAGMKQRRKRMKKIHLNTLYNIKLTLFRVVTIRHNAMPEPLQQRAVYLQHELESTWGGCHWGDRRPPEPTAPPHSGRSLSVQPSRAQNGLQHPAYPHRLQSPSAHAAPASGPCQPEGAEEGRHNFGFNQHLEVDWSRCWQRELAECKNTHSKMQWTDWNTALYVS